MSTKHTGSAADAALYRRLRDAVLRDGVLPARHARRVLLAKAGVYFLLLAGCYAGLLTTGSPGAYLALNVALGLVVVLIGFNFAHDFSHRTIFRSQRANDWCFRALYALAGAHAEAWQKRHTGSHHNAPNVTAHDADLQLTTLIRVAPDAPWQWWHRWQHWYALPLYTTYSLFWIFVKDVRILRRDGRSGRLPFRYLLSFWLQKAFYVAYILALPMLASRQSWGLVLGGFLLMHAVQSLFLLLTFFISHHVEATRYFTTNEAGRIETSWLQNQIGSSNDFYPFSPLANCLFGGFNNHVAHHLFPHIASVHYPRVSRTLYRVLAAEAGITPNQCGYFRGVASHLRHLRRLGRAA